VGRLTEVRIKLIAVGSKMPTWIVEGFTTYQKRFTRELKLELVEIPAQKRGKNANIARILSKEGDAMLGMIAPQDYVVALDLSHQQWTTPELARHLEQWQHRGQDLVLLVGGPEGLAPACKQRADQVWCLSALTLPHPMVRVIVAESLYRAWSLLNNHPYHRE
jgi:23S rRNA (pseudouridine1915-N3)-methyltransferase